MKFNKNWLDTFVPNNLSAQELCDKITMSGLEVDSLEPVSGKFNNVVVGHVIDCKKHPDSDHLQVATVDVGNNEILNIVCGAKNCRSSLKVCCAKIGAILPNDFKINKTKLRGVDSEGMLCSYKELGMEEESDGIIELPDDAPVGMDVFAYFNLDDVSIDVDLTSNRADCLSVLGIAREVSVITNHKLNELSFSKADVQTDKKVSFSIEDTKACPRYLTKVVCGIDKNAKSPIWLTERLRRCNIRSISPIVDVTNYVMLELGQPLHSFDLNKLNGPLAVRWAKENESLVLLSEQEVKLKKDTLVIADSTGPLALAGIFGGLKSGISADTCDVVFESAFFSPLAIKGRARAYGLNTDASHRFERGVDFNLQNLAIERAASLLQQIAGGKVGPTECFVDESNLPTRSNISVRTARLNKILGTNISTEQIFNIMKQLGFEPVEHNDCVSIKAPSFRFDIEIEEDLIEEVARIYGYNNIENQAPYSTLVMGDIDESELKLSQIKDCLVNLSYNEVITYSFTDPNVLKEFSEIKPIMVNGAISPELSAMRTSLLSGLAIACKYNLNRQQKRIKFFETGLSYIQDKDSPNGVCQKMMIAGIITGNSQDELWCNSKGQFDFYDLKGDIQKVISLCANDKAFSIKETKQIYLHPGQGADLYKDGVYIGSFGMLHPKVQKALGLKQNVGVFEIAYEPLSRKNISHFSEISKFPAIKRDFAFLLDKKYPSELLTDAIAKVDTNLIKEVRIFDVFADAQLGDNRSVALSVTIQDNTKTLDEKDIESLVNQIVNKAQEQFGASLRA